MAGNRMDTRISPLGRAVAVATLYRATNDHKHIEEIRQILSFYPKPDLEAWIEQHCH